jgi:hypothetical protein
MRLALPIAVLLLLATGCTTETSHGYYGEFSLMTFAASDPGTGWGVSLTHDIFWDGEDATDFEVRCSETEEGGERILQFTARDETFEQGFEFGMRLQPFTGNGQYLVDDTLDDLGLEVSVVTAEQTFDLATSRSGSCNVTISNDDLVGDFSCSDAEEYVNYVQDDLPFTVKGHWECATIELDG